jgi:hypothetical protein
MFDALKRLDRKSLVGALPPGFKPQLIDGILERAREIVRAGEAGAFQIRS